MIYFYFIIDTYNKAILYRLNTKFFANIVFNLEKFFSFLFFGREYIEQLKIVKVSTKQLYDFVSISNNCKCSGVYNFDNLSCFVCSSKDECKNKILKDGFNGI